MKLETEQHGTITIVKLCENRLDAALSVRFKEGMRDIVDSGANDVVLDLGDVAFMDSSGLGAVVAVMKHMGREKTFRIAALTPAVDKVFKLTRMDNVFNILGSSKEAISSDIAANS